MQRNFVETLQACRGEYVAILEGDDYWIDPHKLQRQVDYLERCSDCAICFHNVMGFREDGTKPEWSLVSSTQKEDSTIDDLLEGFCPPTCSVVFRRDLVGELPGWYFSSGVGDWPLFIQVMLNSQEGKIKYLAATMAAYRVHSGGCWSALDDLKRTRHIYRICKALLRQLDSRQQARVNVCRLRCWFRFASYYHVHGDRMKAQFYLRRIRRHTPLYILRCLNGRDRPRKEIFKLLGFIYAPGIHRTLRSAKRFFAQDPVLEG